MARDNEAEFIYQALRGQADAIDLCNRLFRASQLFDDLHDGDQAVTKDQVHRLLWDVMVEIPSNPFYQRHFAALQPLIRGMALDWIDSCALERGTEHEKSIAFVLRDSIGAIVSHCAYLIGGYDHMRTVSVPVRQHIFEESLTAYRQGLEQEDAL